jgi:hypothetical protein
MKKKELTTEGLADLAYKAESDHEVQMARAELYKVAKYAIKLHEMMKGVSEADGLEGWVQAKITKAADYISSVYSDYKTSLSKMLENKLGICKECGKPSYTTLPEEKQKGVDGKVCWKGYKRMGTKKKGGKTVDNCVKM